MLSKLPPAELWQFAMRVYEADDDLSDWQAREMQWLNRAQTAYAAGNFVHLPRAVLLCQQLEIPPPEWLAISLAEVFCRIVGGMAHGEVVRRVAEAVIDFEALLKIENIRAWDRHLRVEHDLRRLSSQGEDVYDRAAHEFAQEAESQVWLTVARRRDAIEKQVRRARTRLQDRQFQAFMGANFAPALISQLTGRNL